MIPAGAFAQGEALLPVEEAIKLLEARLAAIAPVEAVDVPLAAALGRILADDLVAPMNVPPHDNCAVDGYAFRHSDLAGAETRLRVTQRAAAGHPATRPVGAGEAVRVFTGAVLPDGADTVAMQEDCQTEGDAVVVPGKLKRSANRRKAGEDIIAGRVILPSGRKLRPQDIGLAASIGATSLMCRRPLRVAVFSTGDEVTEPGRPLPKGAVYDANRAMLRALLASLGFTVVDLGILPDLPGAIGDALAAAADGNDALITSGGMSTGEEDHVKAAVESLGRLDFWRLAIKPGRPIALGRIKGKAFVGLPGNPVAAMVTFLRFARPLLNRLAGAEAPPLPYSRLPAAFAYDKKPGRREWLRAKRQRDENGAWVVRKYPRDGAGILTSLVESDGLVEVSEACAGIAEGDLVDFLPFSEVLT
ncbi:MAG: molybdopterin molybdotransferase MoeA [Alphaproteobacteria bacterium]|nr:molybdopterin molybdotransferase MoeA [Alphaproteobacteria bacterium]